MKDNVKIGILGGGSWATALAYILHKNGHTLRWWMRKPDNIDDFKQLKHNPNYLAEAHFDTDQLEFSTDPEEVIRQSDMLILAIPSAFVHEMLHPLSEDPTLFKGKTVFSAVKGIIPETNQIVGDYLSAHYQLDLRSFGVITGPCHAEEIALERLSYITVASLEQEVAQEMSSYLSCRFVKTVISGDIYGAEMSSVLKNIVAVVTGVALGLQYGDNFIAVLISNAIREMKAFLDEYHPLERDINDSAYLGDLLVTCYSRFSRNRMFGQMLGRGHSVKQAQLEMNMIAEGYYAIQCVQKMLEEREISSPLFETAYNIVYRHISPRMELHLLSESLN